VSGIAKALLQMTWRSIANRRLAVWLTICTVALSVTMLLGVERLRQDVRSAFMQTVSGSDLLVGARSGPVQLLLYAVFHLGSATNNVSWQSIGKIAALPEVAWVVPISLGDSHRGFRVVGTDASFFRHYRYGRDRALAFSSGKPFDGLFDAVVGAEVAARFGYRPGDALVLSHGESVQGTGNHDDRPFTVVGILARTGTPVDRSVLVSLQAIEAIHVDWTGGMRLPGLTIPSSQLARFDLTPKSVTAALIGLKSRIAVFRVQRYINTFSDEPLLAVLPGATLQELWRIVAVVEKALLVVSALVVLVGLMGLVAVVVASLNERRRELAILRALGAGPRHVFALLMLESLLIGIGGCLFGVVLLQAATIIVGPWLEAQYGLPLQLHWLTPVEWQLLAAVMTAAVAAGVVPAVRAYRYSLVDGMTVKL